MILTMISDLHGFKPELPGGDILIVGGDWTARDTEAQCFEFFDWFSSQNYKHKILIAGNHDNRAQKESCTGPVGKEFYLCDSGCEIEGIQFWGSPYTKKFYTQNPLAMAFALDTDTQMMEKWDLIPDDTEILITHTPPFGILDVAYPSRRTGCSELLAKIVQLEPAIHCFGHLHESYGTFKKGNTKFINCSHVNRHYEPINAPITLEYEPRKRGTCEKRTHRRSGKTSNS